MKTYDEISRNVLERRDEYLCKQKIKRNKLFQAAATIGCLIIVVGIGLGYGDWSRKPTVNPNIIIGGESVQTAPLTTYATEFPTENTATTFPATAVTTVPAISFSTTAPPSGELYQEIDWDYKSTPGKYCAVVLDSAKYGDVTIKSNIYSDFNEYVYPFRPGEEQPTTRKATEFISDMQIMGHEPDGTAHETVVDIFTLEGLSSNLAIGVRFPDDDRIYTYVNSSYMPETLGEFLDAIDYDNTVTYGGITLYPGNNFPVNSQNFKDIKSYLLSDAQSVNIHDMSVTGASVTATIYCRELGRENKFFKINEDGYISTNLIGYEYVFYVGKQAVADFLKDSYNITFEQIKATYWITMKTTEPYTANATASAPASPPEFDVATTYGYKETHTTTDPMWWCDTATE